MLDWFILLSDPSLDKDPALPWLELGVDEVRLPLPPEEAEDSDEYIERLSENAESLSGDSVLKLLPNWNDIKQNVI